MNPLQKAFLAVEEAEEKLRQAKTKKDIAEAEKSLEEAKTKYESLYLATRSNSDLESNETNEEEIKNADTHEMADNVPLPEEQHIPGEHNSHFCSCAIL